MLQDAATSCNDIPFPPNVFSAEYFDWGRFIYAYARTSPDQGEQRTGEWQLEAIGGFARSRGLTVASYRSDAGCHRDRIGPTTRPGLTELIEWATCTGYPIVAFEWRRFAGNPMKLARTPHVRFVSITPLWIDAKRLDSIARREANRLDPAKRGGRPTFEPSPDDERLLRQLWDRYPVRVIARELGWPDHKLVSRVARRLGLVGRNPLYR